MVGGAYTHLVDMLASQYQVTMTRSWLVSREVSSYMVPGDTTWTSDVLGLVN